jgi:hypothetical protein
MKTHRRCLMEKSDKQVYEQGIRSKKVQKLLNQIHEKYAPVIATKLNDNLQYFLPVSLSNLFPDEEYVYVPILSDDSELGKHEFLFRVPPYAISGLQAYPIHGITREGFVVSLNLADAADLDVDDFYPPREVKELVDLTID